MTEKLAV